MLLIWVVWLGASVGETSWKGKPADCWGSNSTPKWRPRFRLCGRTDSLLACPLSRGLDLVSTAQPESQSDAGVQKSSMSSIPTCPPVGQLHTSCGKRMSSRKCHRTLWLSLYPTKQYGKKRPRPIRVIGTQDGPSCVQCLRLHINMTADISRDSCWGLWEAQAIKYGGNNL